MERHKIRPADEAPAAANASSYNLCQSKPGKAQGHSATEPICHLTRYAPGRQDKITDIDALSRGEKHHVKKRQHIFSFTGIFAAYNLGWLWRRWRYDLRTKWNCEFFGSASSHRNNADKPIDSGWYHSAVHCYRPLFGQFNAGSDNDSNLGIVGCYRCSVYDERARKRQGCLQGEYYRANGKYFGLDNIDGNFCHAGIHNDHADQSKHGKGDNSAVHCDGNILR